MALLTEAAAERTLDRDFDQTALHNHAKDQECPTCRAVENFHPPTVLEQRILELEEELRVANERVKAFEKFTANLSAHIDGMQQAVEHAIKPRAEFPRAA